MRTGTEDRSKIYLFSFLCVIVVAMAMWEFHGTLTGQPLAAVHVAPHKAATAQRLIESKDRQDNAESDLKLHIGQLGRVEQVAYSSEGRDIFSPMTEAPKIEVPLAPPRPSPVTATTPAPPPERPKPPAMEMKYVGFALGSDKAYNAILLRGNDSLIARTGEIVFHHYKIGVIQPTSVQVTDLTFNNTESIHLAEK
jgi:hypothetical protein